MPEREDEPAASTQMFRAFVERGEPEPPPNRTVLRVSFLLAALAVVAVGVWLLVR